MLPEFKKRIDTLRQILVGAVPSPAGQIEQITFALIYKFMNDIDDRATNLPDGKRTYFVGDYDKYSWHNILAPTLGAHDRLTLYREALASLAKNPNLPELFQSIYQNAYLPFNDPRVLTLFLKEVDHFKHSNSDDIGDAYEYLLQITGAQGDVGQFRTPRHIINFIVDVIAPTKDDSVLDPACGTAGFLISAFNYVKHQHDGIDSITGQPNSERQLTADELSKLHKNYHGFDIDPTMVRTAKVNMYLHGFKEPDIKNHDSLSSEDFWNERYDVILANPPFMTPKGGIVPHKKFGVQSNRAEVLFVDYIKSHLKPTGRAGIIVPEGIIFQSGNAYKQLRKSLVEDGLYAVISLPSGIFAPYSGVKTSVLLFDNEITKTKKEILFIKVSNDGFDLGAQRREITNNDLPKALEILKKWKTAGKVEDKIVTYVEKVKIAESGDYNLSGDRYRAVTDYSNAKWPIVEFDDVVITLTPPKKISKEHYCAVGSFPIIDQSQDEIAGWTNDKAALIKNNKPLVIFGDHTCAVKYINKSFAQGADGIKILLTNDKLIPKFFYYVLKAKPIESSGYQRHFSKLKRYKIPLPPLEIQEQVVAELDRCQNIISGAKQIVANWKPKIEIDPKWDKLRIGKIADVLAGQSPEGKFYNDNGEGVPFYQGKTEFNDIYLDNPKKWTTQITKIAEAGDILMSMRAPVGPVNIATQKICIGRGLAGIRATKVEQMFLFTYLQMIEKEIIGNGGAVFDSISKSQIEQIEIPTPPSLTQKQIVSKIESERALVESAKKLIEIYEQKTKDTISKLWEIE